MLNVELSLRSHFLNADSLFGNNTAIGACRERVYCLVAETGVNLEARVLSTRTARTIHMLEVGPDP